MTAISTAIVLAASYVSAGQQDDDLSPEEALPSLRYVEEPVDIRPIWTVIEGRDEPSPDLEFEITLSRDQQSYVEVRFGVEGSIRICIVIDRDSNGQFDLYADFNRNRIIEESELIGSDDNQHEFEVSAMFVPAEPVATNAIDATEDAASASRTMLFRIGRTSHRHSIATKGAMVGQVQLGDSTVDAVLIDGNANGLFTDSVDRVLIDSDGNGEFHHLTEQFVVTPLLTMNENRYAMSIPLDGQTISLQPADEVGVIDLSVGMIDDRATIEQIHLLMFNDSNEAVAVHGLGLHEIPCGNYQVSTLQLEIVDEDDRRWGFAFRRQSGRRFGGRFQVSEGDTTAFDPLRGLQFQLIGAADIDHGSIATVQPMVTTETSLYLTFCGESVFGPNQLSSNGHTAITTCVSTIGEPIFANWSGFS